jgi:hypothetical protein
MPNWADNKCGNCKTQSESALEKRVCECGKEGCHACVRTGPPPAPTLCVNCIAELRARAVKAFRLNS